MEIKYIVDQIEYLTKRLSKLGEEDEDVKKTILCKINSLCLDLIKKIREKESDRLLEQRNAALQKRYHRLSCLCRENEKTIKKLQLKIARLQEKLHEARSRVRVSGSNDKELHQELLKAKEKIIADYLAHNKSKEIDLEKRSQLFNW